MECFTGSSSISADAQWFVLNEGGYDGPYPSSTIHAMLVNEALTGDDQVWSEGMTRWTPIDEVLSLSPESMKSSMRVEHEDRPLRGTPLQLIRTQRGRAALKKLKRRWSRVGIGIAMASLLAGASVLVHVTYRNKSAPHLPDISSADSRIVQAVVSGKTDFSGYIALGGERRSRPIIHVATRRGGVRELSIGISPVAGKVLSSRRMNIVQRMPVREGVASSMPFSLENDSPIPRGEYRVRATSDQQDLLAEREVFLGGERDEAFDEELARFNRRLVQKSQAELFEFRQVASSLEDQLRQTDHAFQQAVGDPGAVRAWAAFARKWTAFQSQLQQQLQLPPSPVEEDIPFHDRLHSDLLALIVRLRSLHEKQAEWMRATRKGDISEIADLASLVGSEILSIQMRISAAERSKGGVNGLPAREEIR